MKIVVIGATGLVGSATVKELAQRGHQVIALARDAEKVQKTPNITAVSADVNAMDFYKHLQNADAVISAFNAGWTNPNLAHDYTQGYQRILEAAKKAQVPYLLVVGGAGSLYVAPNLQLVDTPDFPKEYYQAADAVRNLLNDLKPRRDVNWAFFSPAAMFAVNPVRFERTGKYRLGKDEVLMTQEGIPADISVSDLACVLADDAEQQAYLFERFTAAE
ncbi:NAD(P)-dependent oxidoreductase [Capnocytophaga sp.]|uniref:NAD(P)-dependent oxidoreductase n=1 Tax=Capnocytophaga sp. TaxID=44737 RepID=UPI0026DDACAB|nr:NAD(P)H-binding protein [Capnocytophaga sp.]MDO5105219.1 NAD(P)H-binding protein [Capnocytophaga sp.]